MNVIRKLRLKFVAVFMGLMLLFSAAIGIFVYFERKAELEYQCMVYLLDIHNANNRGRPSGELSGAYPPYFVLEIDNMTETAKVVEGRFFPADSGVTPDELIVHLIGRIDESGILPEYGIRYLYGVREERAHRVSFIDVSYIDNDLHALLCRIVLIEIPSLLVLSVAAFFLSRWFSAPARKAMDEQMQFIAKVSHELKTPVSIIRANIDLIDGDKQPEEADLLFGCENIRHECSRMTGLVEAMLLTGLIAHDPARPHAELDMSSAFEREMLRFEVVAFDQGLVFTHEAETGLTVMGDEIQITRLVDIIVENAIKYCTPGGEIRVTAERKKSVGHHVRLVCMNDGTELKKEQRDYIFKPFYQVDSTQKGAGLGLSIAHEIVTAMNGTIEYAYIDGKNCFTVEI